MPIYLIILADIAVIALVIGLALVVGRQVEAVWNVRRRLRDETTSAPKRSVLALVRSRTIRNPALAWVQRATLSDPEERDKLSRNLVQAGFESPSATAWFVVIRFALAIGLPIAFIYGQPLLAHKQTTGLKLVVVPLMLAALGLYLPGFFVNSRAKARRTQIEQEFPDTLDLLVVCVEAGLGLEAGLIRVADETETSHPLISIEIQKVSQDLRVGRSRADALRGLADRTQVDTIKAFCSLMIQTDAMGGSVAQSLRTYSQEMRAHRMLKAEEKAMRIPVLLTIPLVACMLPVIIAAILLPPIIDVMRILMPALAGH